MAIALSILVVIVSVSAVADVVSFPDPGLEAAIREAINKPTGDIHDANLAELTHLDARERSISNLAGIQHCIDLMELNLWLNEIIEISPLSGLTNLTAFQYRPQSAISNVFYINSGFRLLRQCSMNILIKN